MATRYLISIIAIAIAGSSSAQFTPDSDAYQAWKLTQVQQVQPEVQPPAIVGNTRSQRDNEPCACWIEPDSTYTLALAPNDDGSSPLINLPFTFSLYGDQYTSCYINNNGNISFITSYGTYSASSFPNTQFKMLAPFWADVDTRAVGGGSGGTVTYRLTATALYVNWTAVGYYNQQIDKLNSFQLIVTDGIDPVIAGGNNVSFCYGTMQWTTGSASQGVGGFGGIPATVGANRGDGIDYLQLGRFDHDSTDWDGSFDNNDGVAWLVDRHFSFNTFDANIPPIFTSIGCDTLDIEVGSSLEYPMMVIAGGSGQGVSGTAQCPTIANYVMTTSNFGNGMQLMSTITPTASEVGIHAITYMAESNDPVPLTSTYTVYVKVLAATTGIHEASKTTKLSVQPNPASDRATITWPEGQRPALIEVFSLTGALVLAETPGRSADRLDLDLSSLPDGVYTVRSTGATSTAAVRLVRSSVR